MARDGQPCTQAKAAIGIPSAIRSQNLFVGTISRDNPFVEHELALLSPEKTILTYRLASLGGRIFAHLIDLLIILFILFITGVGMAVSGVLGQGVLVLSSTLYLIFAATFPLLYFILFESLWN